MVTYMRCQIIGKCHCCPSSAILDITGEKTALIVVKFALWLSWIKSYISGLTKSVLQLVIRAHGS